MEKRTRTKTSTNSFKGGKYDWSQRIYVCMLNALCSCCTFMRFGCECVWMCVYLFVCVHVFVPKSFCIWWFSCLSHLHKRIKIKIETNTHTHIHASTTNREKSIVTIVAAHYTRKWMLWNFRARVARFVLLIWLWFCVVPLAVFCFYSLLRLFVLWHNTKTN